MVAARGGVDSRRRGAELREEASSLRAEGDVDRPDGEKDGRRLLAGAWRMPNGVRGLLVGEGEGLARPLVSDRLRRSLAGVGGFLEEMLRVIGRELSAIHQAIRRGTRVLHQCEVSNSHLLAVLTGSRGFHLPLGS